MLNKGAVFFQNLCTFDSYELKKELDDEIAFVEAQIAKSKAGSIERQRQKLAELIQEVDNGKIWELGAIKNAKFEAEIRKKFKEELRKEIEAEYAAKIAEA